MRAEGDAHFQSSFAAPACIKLILPREAGKGDHAKHGGRGFGGATRFILPREAGKGDRAQRGGRGFGGAARFILPREAGKGDHANGSGPKWPAR